MQRNMLWNIRGIEMTEIHCIDCNIFLCYMNDNAPTGFFYCAAGHDIEKEKDDEN